MQHITTPRNGAAESTASASSASQDCGEAISMSSQVDWLTKFSSAALCWWWISAVFALPPPFFDRVGGGRAWGTRRWAERRDCYYVVWRYSNPTNRVWLTGMKRICTVFIPLYCRMNRYVAASLSRKIQCCCICTHASVSPLCLKVGASPE